MTELQKFADKFGFGISVKELAKEAYFYMVGQGFKVCMVNERYLEVNGTTYLFSKSKKQGGWIVKAI